MLTLLESNVETRKVLSPLWEEIFSILIIDEVEVYLLVVFCKNPSP